MLLLPTLQPVLELCTLSAVFNIFLRVEVTEANVSVMAADGREFCPFWIGVGTETFADEVESCIM